MSEPNAASVAMIGGNRVLLIKRAFEPLKGLWTLPGGRREDGEAIETTASREVREELGLVVGRLRPVTALVVGGRFRLQVFATTNFSGEIAPSDEIGGWRWSEPHELAGLATTPGLDAVLKQAFALFSE